MSLNLMPALVELTEFWLFQHKHFGRKEVTLATLGARVHKDAKLFERLEAGGSISVERFEALIEYLANPESWPRPIPESALSTLRRLGIVQPGERLVVERDTVERQTIREA